MIPVLAGGLVVGALLPRVPKLFEKSETTGDYSLYLEGHRTQVVLYGTSACSFCRMARSFLRERNVAFVDLDVQGSEQAAREHARLGGEGVPLVLIGNRMIKGFHPDKYSDAILDLRRR